MIIGDLSLVSLDRFLPVSVWNCFIRLSKQAKILHQVPVIADTAGAFVVWMKVCGRPEQVMKSVGH